MNPDLAAELARTRAVFDAVGTSFPETPGASDDDLQRIRQETGIEIGGDLADLYRAMDGSGYATVFAVHSDEDTPLDFSSLADALDHWQSTGQIAEEVRALDREAVADPRIRHAAWAHPRWFPFAEFNGGSTTVYYDADPGPGGTVGQVLVYQHDPDAVYYVAPDVRSFLRRSNELLKANADEFVAEESSRP